MLTAFLPPKPLQEVGGARLVTFLLAEPDCRFYALVSPMALACGYAMGYVPVPFSN